MTMAAVSLADGAVRGTSFPPSATPLLRAEGISKAFGAVDALRDVSLSVAAGEVVALVGDNGAGKSTLVKILAGVIQPDRGVIALDGKPVTFDGPGTARDQGIATIFQDLALCDNLSVFANLFLGREIRRGGFLDHVEMERRAWELLGQLSAKIPSVQTTIAGLSGGQRQTVAIARSLLGNPRVILLDEPTAALGVAQTAEVLALIRRLRDRGHGVILISHNMADVMSVSDRIVVLRLGRNAAEFDAAATSHQALVAAITGAVASRD